MITRGLDIAKGKISQFEDIAIEIQSKQKIILNDQIINDCCKKFKHPNVNVMRVSEREKETEKKIIKEIMSMGLELWLSQ